MKQDTNLKFIYVVNKIVREPQFVIVTSIVINIGGNAEIVHVVRVVVVFVFFVLGKKDQ